MFSWLRRWRLRRQMRSRPVTPIRGGGRFRRTLVALVNIPKAMLGALLVPFQLVFDFSGRTKRRIGDLLLGIPAALLALLLIGVMVYADRKSTDTELRYWRAMANAMSSDDYAKGKLIVQRALNSGVVDRQEAAFALAQVHQRTGAEDRAKRVLDDLAPEDRSGYPPAHRMLAIMASERFRITGDPAEVERLRWHLEHADQEKSPDMYRASGLYYASQGNTDKAIEVLLLAVESRPDVYFEIAELLVRKGRREEASKVIQKAETVYQARFDADPLDDEARLRLATTLFALGKLPDAERLVKERLATGDDKKFRQLLSIIFVRFFDYQIESDQPLAEALASLQKSLDADVDNREALQRLWALATRKEESRDEVRTVLLDSIAAGGSSAMAHFVLGVVEWLEDNRDSASFHLERALELAPGWGVVANNLAYLQAMDENSDLEGAEQLASIAVQSDPGNAEYWDTRAIIRQKRGDLRGAATDFQQALDRAPDKAKFRTRLASIYRQMGQNELAEAFERADPKEASLNATGP